MMVVAGMFSFNLQSINKLYYIYFSVPQEKFVEFITTTDDYRNHLNRSSS